MSIKEKSSNFGESTSLQQILNETQLSQITKESAEKDFKDIDSLINKILKEDKASSSHSSNSKMLNKSNSMISNLEIWTTNQSRDDSKVFYETYKDIKTKKKYGSNWKKTNKKKTLVINTDAFPKKKIINNEDYCDDLDESIMPVKQKHVDQIQNFETKQNNLTQIAIDQGNKFLTCPDNENEFTFRGNEREKKCSPLMTENAENLNTRGTLATSVGTYYPTNGIFPIIPPVLNNSNKDNHNSLNSLTAEKMPQTMLIYKNIAGDATHRKNLSSTRQSTESNDSENFPGAGKYYTPKHMSISNPMYNLNQVQRELDFCGTASNNLNTKFTNARTNPMPITNNHLMFHPQTPVQNIKSLSFCINNMNSTKTPTAIKIENNPITRPFDSKIILDNIITGKDKRTTLMLRNIPNKYTLQNIVDEISSSFWGKYDFINLPIDYERKLNLGYAFINFVDPLHIVLFFETYHLKKWAKYKSDKKINLNYADKQGKKDITCKDDNTYFACEDKRFNFKTISPKIEIPSKYLTFFKKIYPNSVCVLDEKNSVSDEKVFSVKNVGRRQSFL